MTRFEALVALNMVSDIGSIRLGKLLDFFGTPQNILRAPREKLTSIFGIGGKIAEQIHSFRARALERELSLAKKHKVRIMTIDDADYHRGLKNIPDPPIVLYLKGELKAEDHLAIGIVGSRRASFYGLSCAEKFAGELAGHGFTVVSGMARGIDTAAHRGALRQGGRTVAVIGSGFNNIYPEENHCLAEKISASGAVVSEFSFDARPLAQNFPRRNRVISGLSLGVLVVEAAQNSGALITADFALEQNREVFALPGKIDAANSFGSNELIKQGAKPVTCVDDILEEFSAPADAGRGRRGKAAPGPVPLACADEGDEEGALYRLISGGAIGFDELIEKTAMDIPKISGILLRLQMRKMIAQLPGKQFVRSSE